MATSKTPPPSKKKSSQSLGSMLLDSVAWGVGQAALPIPENPFKRKKKKYDVKKKK